MADQRKRTGLTSEYEEWLRQQLARLSAGPRDQNVPSLSSPPLTKYADIEDPRAGRSRLGKPIGGFLDSLVRPGRVEQMDADQRTLSDRRMQYAEQRPAIQAQANTLMTDNQLEELKLLASKGDPDASNLLGKYMQLLNPRSGGGGLDYGMLLTGAKGQGPGDTKVVRKAGPDTPKPPSSEAQPSQRPQETGSVATARRVLKDDFRHGATLALYPEEAIQQAVSKLKERKSKEQRILAEAQDDLAQHPDHPQTSLYIQKAEARIADIDNKLAEISGPLTSPPASGPTVYNPNQ